MTLDDYAERVRLAMLRGEATEPPPKPKYPGPDGFYLESMVMPLSMPFNPGMTRYNMPVEPKVQDQLARIMTLSEEIGLAKAVNLRDELAYGLDQDRLFIYLDRITKALEVMARVMAEQSEAPTVTPEDMARRLQPRRARLEPAPAPTSTTPDQAK